MSNKEDKQIKKAAEKPEEKSEASQHKAARLTSCSRCSVLSLLALVVLVLALALPQSNLFGGTNSSSGKKVPKVKGDRNTLWTPEELKRFDGTEPSRPILLAILGEVFDVTRGGKHYAKGGGYNGFAGRDGTRAFVTGKFDEKGLTPDIEGLSPKDILAIYDWLKFYRKDYIPKGKLIGHYYDKDGNPTEALEKVHKLIKEGERLQEMENKEKEEWPGCNSRWSQNDDMQEGRSLWCSEESGGIKRNWIGRPREMFNSATKEKRCVCAPDNKLNDPRLKVYAGCDPMATMCSWPK